MADRPKTQNLINFQPSPTAFGVRRVFEQLHKLEASLDDYLNIEMGVIVELFFFGLEMDWMTARIGLSLLVLCCVVVRLLKQSVSLSHRGARPLFFIF